jgi:imidazolonepropionase-like amidohydrolase
MTERSAILKESGGYSITGPVGVIILREGEVEYRTVRIEIQDGLIRELKPAGEEPEYYVTAGFINCHAHYVMDAGAGPFDKMIADAAGDPDNKIARAIQYGREMVKLGITYTCDKGPPGMCGAPIYRGIKEAVDAGESMANLKYSTWAMMADGGFGAPYGRVIHNLKEMEVALLESEKTGAEALKFIPESAYKAGTPHYRFMFPEDAFRWARQAAKEKNMVFAVHAKGVETIEMCIRESVDGIEHGIEAKPEHLRAFQENDIYLGPTMDGLLCRLEHAKETGRNAEAVEYDWETVCSMVKTASTLNNGRPFSNFLFASDAGSYATPHASLRELYQLRKNGFPPAAILEAATVNGAKCLKLWDRGTIETGKRADLIFWSTNPVEQSLEEWKHLEKHIAAVALNGKIVKIE